MQWQQELSPEGWKALTALARTAAGASPANPALWLNLARILRRQRREEEVRGALREAIGRLPDDLDLHLALIRAHLDAEDPDAATEAMEGLWRWHDDPRYKLLHFSLLCRNEAWAEAEGLAGEIARLHPSAPALLDYLYARADGPGHLKALVEQCDASLTHDPGFLDAIYRKAFALAKLGAADEACRLVDTDALLDVRELSPPAEFQSGDAFRAQLAQEILADPSLEPDPKRKATRGGRQTGPLPYLPGSALAGLLARIKEAVDDYSTMISERSALMAAARPATARLGRWGVVYGAGGRQLSHRHPNGWVSGVYYVAAPRDPETGTCPGSLLVGAVDRHRDGVSAPWAIREIEPVPGRLVLFPSYFPHATAKSGATGAKISIAFDVRR